MLRRLFLALVLVATFASAAEAQQWVRSYYRYDGTYVRGHYRSTPDGYFWNNWSSYGNVNPYTGSIGTRRYPSYRSYNPYRPIDTYQWYHRPYWP